jgi:hypothetical protein
MAGLLSKPGARTRRRRPDGRDGFLGRGWNTDGTQIFCGSIHRIFFMRCSEGLLPHRWVLFRHRPQLSPRHDRQFPRRRFLSRHRDGKFTHRNLRSWCGNFLSTRRKILSTHRNILPPHRNLLSPCIKFGSTHRNIPSPRINRAATHRNMV